MVFAVAHRATERSLSLKLTRLIRKPWRGQHQDPRRRQRQRLDYLLAGLAGVGATPYRGWHGRAHANPSKRAGGF